jgi:hypothetical protein
VDIGNMDVLVTIGPAYIDWLTGSHRGKNKKDGRQAEEAC